MGNRDNPSSPLQGFFPGREKGTDIKYSVPVKKEKGTVTPIGKEPGCEGF